MQNAKTHEARISTIEERVECLLQFAEVFKRTLSGIEEFLGKADKNGAINSKSLYGRLMGLEKGRELMYVDIRRLEARMTKYIEEPEPEPKHIPVERPTERPTSWKEATTEVNNAKRVISALEHRIPYSTQAGIEALRGLIEQLTPLMSVTDLCANCQKPIVMPEVHEGTLVCPWCAWGISEPGEFFTS